MIQIGDKVKVRGQVGTVIWIDPWDNRTVAVRFMDGYVDEVVIEECTKTTTGYSLVSYLKFRMTKLLRRSVKRLRG